VFDGVKTLFEKEDKKTRCTGKVIMHCCFTPIVFSLGYTVIKTDSKVITQAERRKQRGYSKKTEKKPRDFKTIKPDVQKLF
jgi:hypothetical protein